MPQAIEGTPVSGKDATTFFVCASTLRSGVPSVSRPGTKIAPKPPAIGPPTSTRTVAVTRFEIGSMRDRVFAPAPGGAPPRVLATQTEPSAMASDPGAAPTGTRASSRRVLAPMRITQPCGRPNWGIQMDPNPTIAWVASVTAESDGKGTRVSTGTLTGVSSANVESWGLPAGMLVRGPGGGLLPHAARRSEVMSKPRTRWRIAFVKGVDWREPLIRFSRRSLERACHGELVAGPGSFPGKNSASVLALHACPKHGRPSNASTVWRSE